MLRDRRQVAGERGGPTCDDHPGYSAVELSSRTWEPASLCLRVSSSVCLSVLVAPVAHKQYFLLREMSSADACAKRKADGQDDGEDLHSMTSVQHPIRDALLASAHTWATCHRGKSLTGSWKILQTDLSKRPRRPHPRMLSEQCVSSVEICGRKHWSQLAIASISFP